MNNSIQQFQQEGVKRLSDIFVEYSNDFSKQAEMICGVRDVVLKLGRDIIKEEWKSKDDTSTVKDIVIASDGAKTVAVAEKTKDETSIRTASYDSDDELTAKASYSTGSGSSITLTKIETSESKVSIPSAVKVGNKTYKVTKISADALSDAKNLKTIGINGKYLKKIENGAFANINPKAIIKIKANKKTYQKVVQMIKKSGVPDTVKFKRIK